MMRILACLLAVLLIGCEVLGPDESDVGASLVPVEDAQLKNDHVTVRVRDHTRITDVLMTPFGDDPSIEIGGGSNTGIWIATDQDGYQSNLATGAPSGINTFKIDSSDSTEAGIFIVTRDSLQQPIDNWPTELGAPTERQRIPRLYGDRMLWVSLEPENESFPANQMVPGIRIGQSLFMFDSGPLERAVFLRFDITNTLDTPIANLHLGFGSDLDLYPDDIPSTSSCNDLWVDDNSSGYDLDRHLSYVYIKPTEAQRADECYGFVAGFSILDMQSGAGLRQPKLAHRIWRERSRVLYGEFAEGLMTSDESILLALQGYAHDGSPMIDPTTGTETKYAFTGDPIAESGWLDVRHDGRALQSIAPIDLAGKETRTMMVVFLVANGPNLSQGLNQLRLDYDAVIANRNLWDY